MVLESVVFNSGTLFLLFRRVGTAHRNAANIYREGGQCPPYQSDKSTCKLTEKKGEGDQGLALTTGIRVNASKLRKICVMVGCAMRTKMPRGRCFHGAHGAPYIPATNMRERQKFNGNYLK